MEVFPISTLSEFKKLFYAQFYPINTATKAINKLEGTTRYQESYAVKHYLDKF